MRILLATTVFVLVAFVIACGSSESDGTPKTACVPGESKPCTGPAGCIGGQVCNGDGSGYLPCDCGSATGGAGGGDAGADATSSFCPTGLAGPELVEVQDPYGVKYCIDATEVTFAQYDEFLAAKVPTGTQGPECSTNDTFEVGKGYEIDGTQSDCADKIAVIAPDYPVSCVDWCDAVAYCKWAGKRLCGRIGGGAADIGDNDATISQWFNACSAGGTQQFAWGNELKSECEPGKAPVGPVKSFKACVGGFPGLYEMSSNVSEWEDACTDPNVDRCRIRGDFGGHCDAITTDNERRQELVVRIGFRCCHDGS